MSQDPFASGGSDYGPKPPELLGRLLLCYVTDHRTGVMTVNGERDPVDIDPLVILDEDNPQDSEATATSFLQAKLVAKLKLHVGKRPFLGRMAIGEAQQGRNAPYVLTDATEADKVVCRLWLEAQEGR